MPGVPRAGIKSSEAEHDAAFVLSDDFNHRGEYHNNHYGDAEDDAKAASWFALGKRGKLECTHDVITSPFAL